MRDKLNSYKTIPSLDDDIVDFMRINLMNNTLFFYTIVKCKCVVNVCIDFVNFLIKLSIFL